VAPAGSCTSRAAMAASPERYFEEIHGYLDWFASQQSAHAVWAYFHQHCLGGMVTQQDNMLRLRDGRQLAFAEYGDPHGSPVMLFHGNPSSRVSWGLMPGAPFRPHLRLIAPDRPGFGRSDFQPGRRLLDWPDDVCELADALGLGRFAVLGVSGGGPATLTCAWKIPQRLTAVGVVSSPCPTDVPGATEGMSRTNRALCFLAHHAPALIRLNMAFLAYLARRERLVERLVYKMADVDKAMLGRREIRQYLSAGFAEALRQGGAGSAHELLLNHGRPWGFSLEDIEIGVHVWQGENDPSVPPSMGRYLAQTLPNCEATFIPGAGHLWILDHVGEVLDALVPDREDGAT
jgi:pimeloyl-ACP methyl ester carboxylesterase